MSSFLKPKPIFITIAFLLISVFLASPVLAQYGLDETASAAHLNKTSDIKVVIGNLIYYALSFIGVALIILIIIGGFMWMTAAGDDEKVKKARKIITNAVIGVLIVVFAYSLTWFVINELTTMGSKTSVPAQSATQTEESSQ